jgi:hypothetical protein
VSRETRGPFLLILAAVLSLSAIISSLIDDFRVKAQRQEAIVREQGALRAQDVELSQERTTLVSRNPRETLERAELVNQYNTIIQSLQRIENAVQTSSR